MTQTAATVDDTILLDETTLRRFLAVRAADRSYGVELLSVQEIREFAGVTRVPNSPSYLLGVANLRGAIVPVVDLRIRLTGQKPGPPRVVVLVKTGEKLVGLAVDGVTDLLDVPAEDVQAAATLGDEQAGSRFVTSMAVTRSGVLAILDIERVALDG